jgi:cytochrome c2
MNVVGRAILAISFLGLFGIEAESNVEDGKKIFNTYCIACHNLGAGDSLTGPDLKGVIEKKKYKDEWLHKWIKDPAKLIAGKDSLATQLEEEKKSKSYKASVMVALGLTDDQVRNVIAFLKSQK